MRAVTNCKIGPGTRGCKAAFSGVMFLFGFAPSFRFKEGSSEGNGLSPVLKMSASKRYWMLIPEFSGAISWSMAARYRDKSVGVKTQHCFRPYVMGNASVSLLSWNTRPDIPSCSARIRLLSRSSACCTHLPFLFFSSDVFSRFHWSGLLALMFLLQIAFHSGYRRYLLMTDLFWLEDSWLTLLPHIDLKSLA